MGITRFREIAEVLATELAGLPDGTRAPSEYAVAQRFGVGRSAARAAIVELETRGVVRRIQGSGTYVQQPLILGVEIGRPTAWEQMVRSGKAITTLPLVRSGSLPHAAAAAMNVPAGSPGIRLTMTMTAFGRPIGRSAVWAAGTDRPALVQGVRQEGSLLSAIDAGNVHLLYRSADVTIAPAGPEVAADLGIALDRPYWKVEAVLEDPRTAITVWARTDFRADRITLAMRLAPTTQAGR